MVLSRHVDVAELILDYIRVLVWPALVVFLVIRFRRGIVGFLSRIAGESHEVSASAFGVAFTAKFKERLASLAEQSETADPEELRASVKQTAREFGREQLRALTEGFTNLPISTRREVAEAIADAAADMELDDILEFAESGGTDERIGAAIALRVHLQNSDSAAADPRVRSAIRALLGHRSSFVRYRAAEAVRAAPELARELEEELRRLATEDGNRDVRGMARRALTRAGL